MVLSAVREGMVVAVNSCEGTSSAPLRMGNMA